LEVIKEPDGGYNVEFLRAVVHGARIFIFPLQKSLDLRPQTSEVSQNIVSVPDPRTRGGGSGEVAYINSLWDTASIQAS